MKTIRVVAAVIKAVKEDGRMLADESGCTAAYYSCGEGK